MAKIQSDKQIRQLVEATRVYLCIDCSKCSASCPIGLVGATYSPKRILQDLLIQDQGPTHENLWRCLTCGICSKRCPSNVDFPKFIRLLRTHFPPDQFQLTPSHSGVLMQVAKIMANKRLKPRRTWWLPEFVNVIDEDSQDDPKDIYFVGCAPYFETIFADFNLDLLKTHTAALSLLKRCGVNPYLLPDERCCGHDAIWQGDLETFNNLASLNIDKLRRAGAKRIFVTCPECYYTLAKDYPTQFGDLGFEVINTIKFLSEQSSINLASNQDVAVTYLDSCRMGRFSGIYDEPRKLIRSTGARLLEMPMNSQDAPCCGNSLWINCDWVIKKIQTQCLSQIQSTGAGLWLASCDKCRIHLTCASIQEGQVRKPLTSMNILAFLYRKEVRNGG